MSTKIFFFLLFLILTIAYSCVPEPVVIEEKNKFGQLPKDVTHPADNQFSTEKIALGKQLFWDPILSGNKDVACVSCHHPNSGYAENLDLSIGVGGVGLSENRTGGKLIKRNAPTVLNTAYNGILNSSTYDPLNAVMFWDNRAKSLETQAIQPILNQEEMRGDKIAEKYFMDTLVTRLKNVPQYVKSFEQIFGKNEINEKNIGKAIAAFERTLTAKNSRFDQYAAGDLKALTPLELRGMINFVNVGCNECHSGPMFSDYKLHVIGHPDNAKLATSDNGDGKYAFRTPTLRNLDLTAPYMHNGVFSNLEDVLAFYEELSGVGGSKNPNIPTAQLDPIVKPFNLTNDQIPSIIAFIKSLNDDNFDKEILKSVPSGLKPGGNIKK